MQKTCIFGRWQFKHTIFFLLEAAWLNEVRCPSGRPSVSWLKWEKPHSKMRIYSTSSAFKQQKLEETRDKPWERKKTASRRVLQAVFFWLEAAWLNEVRCPGGRPSVSWLKWKKDHLRWWRIQQAPFKQQKLEETRDKPRERNRS